MQLKFLAGIYFDEIGLCEYAPNNPLKVLHFLLEPQFSDELVFFIALTNWNLDASKMNRGITLCRPPIEDMELLETI